jgi:hypothetical protein
MRARRRCGIIVNLLSIFKELVYFMRILAEPVQKPQVQRLGETDVLDAPEVR